MAQPVIKTSFASGEWAPKLQGRVDIQKYHAGAALLRNFYVDYSGGGASTRPGSKFINQVLNPGARLIAFQPSTTLSYVLEFGNNYIRFYSNGAPIVETAVTIQSITGSPVTVNSTAHGYANGNWLFISGAYYIVINATTNSYQLTDLVGNNILALAGTSSQRVYTITSPYLETDLFPNPATGNPGIKFVQDVTSLIITHSSYSPQVLTIISAANWILTAANFGSSIVAPTLVTITTNITAGNSFRYGYVVTAVDANGQESVPSSAVQVGLATSLQSLTTPGTNQVKWPAVPGAVSYNIYRATSSGTAGPPDYTIASGTQYGFVGNQPGIIFNDSTPGAAADFSQTPPIAQNPFQGAPVTSITLVTNGSNVSTTPAVTIANTGTSQATAIASLKASGLLLASGGRLVNNSGASPNGQTLSFPNGVTAVITSSSNISFGNWSVTGITLNSTGSFTGSTPPTVSVLATGCSGGFAITGGSAAPPTVNITWNVGAVKLIQGGAGFPSAPAVSFSSGTATAIAVLGTAALGNPGVCGFFQTRLVLAAQQQGPQTYNLSQPLSFFNFNDSNPSQDDDGISGTIIGEELNDIRSLTDAPSGMIALTGKGAWLINGGGGISTNSPITPATQSANPQAFNGANDLRPIKNNLDILYGTNKGNYVRDLSYNLYANVYTGADISVFSNHLFFGFYLLDWAWSEEPFKTLWAIRNDGVMLSLGYVKEQELIGWAHHDTDGQFMSCCSVIENINGNIVDAVYIIVQRLVNGQLLQYVERLADRYFPYGYEDSWSVDCALQTQPQTSPTGTLTITGDASTIGNSVSLSDTSDAPFTSGMASGNWIVRAGGGIYQITAFTSTSVVTATVLNTPEFINLYTNVPFPVTTGFTIWQPVTSVTGLTQLIGKTVTGVADGAVVPPTIVSATGSVTLASAATKITLGLAFMPQLQTLPLDLGEPTIQSKRKKIPAVTLRVADTIGLQAGTSFANALSFKDFIIGNLNGQSNSIVTNLFDGDGRLVLDQYWQEPGQLCFQQNLPYPATIIAVIPEVAVGDTKAQV